MTRGFLGCTNKNMTSKNLVGVPGGQNDPSVTSYSEVVNWIHLKMHWNFEVVGFEGPWLQIKH